MVYLFKMEGSLGSENRYRKNLRHEDAEKGRDVKEGSGILIRQSWGMLTDRLVIASPCTCRTGCTRRVRLSLGRSALLFFSRPHLSIPDNGVSSGRWPDDYANKIRHIFGGCHQVLYSWMCVGHWNSSQIRLYPSVSVHRLLSQIPLDVLSPLVTSSQTIFWCG